MKNIIILISLSALLINCSSADTSKAENSMQSSTPNRSRSKAGKQLNLTIFLDLSDRIDSVLNPTQPQHYKRDTILISHITDYFIREMELKGGLMSNGKMRVVFQPTPDDPDINNAAAKMNINLSGMKPTEKKVVRNNLNAVVSENLGKIYSTSLRQAKWPGSDIWRFFKNDVKTVAIDNDTNYRNVLIIFTDGYIYHNQTKEKDGNRFTYITPELLGSYKLRGSGIAQKIQKIDFGLITSQTDLQNLEILVLEVSPSADHKNDEDVIHTVLKKWFSEMNVKRFEIFNSDLPSTTKSKINGFLNQ